MCGIAGTVDLAGKAIDSAELLAMAEAIRHRGPDDEGYVIIDQASGGARSFSGSDSPASVRDLHPPLPSDALVSGNIGLAHRRFSIIDLSAAGHQPFFAGDRSCCVVFNGEIYNYLELREQLASDGVVFRTRSDTEVLVEAYRVWGTDCFRRFNGFWAIALYDFRKRRLVLSRDRLGKRPLYYVRLGDRIWFASEIKALLRVPQIAQRRTVRPDAAWHWCVDGLRDLDDTTFFDGIDNLPAASWTVLDADFPRRVSRFWQVPQTRLRESDISVADAAREVRERLRDAVRLRLRADVPVAFELSGGLDSSAVLALACSESSERLRSYTVRFEDPRWNEEPFAREVARRWNVDYRVLDPVLDRFWQNIGAFTELQEEPYHSPNMQVSQEIWALMRAEGTKVVLTGSSGDEMFAGYAKYYWRVQIENLVHGRWRYFMTNARQWTEHQHSLARVAREAALALGLRRPARALKYRLTSSDDYLKVRFPRRQYYAASLTQWLHQDITNTLIPYWLMSGDKTLMGLPMEGRCPFLDYRVVELATTLPVTYLVRDGWHKWILRKAMEDLLPREIVWRRVKMGFPYPYEQFYEKYRGIVDLILDTARNPFIDTSKRERLRTDWRALSFLLWYELFFNDNRALFRRIEAMAPPRQSGPYVPAFLQTRTTSGEAPRRQLA
ncbi:MAG: asparagine synthase (glutamine-hydrolyzing) [Sulfurifustis sp.]